MRMQHYTSINPPLVYLSTLGYINETHLMLFEDAKNHRHIMTFKEAKQIEENYAKSQV